MSHDKRKYVPELKVAKLISKINQGVEGNSLKVVKKEKEESYVETESSNETIKFCGFKTNKLCVMTGVS